MLRAFILGLVVLTVFLPPGLAVPPAFQVSTSSNDDLRPDVVYNSSTPSWFIVWEESVNQEIKGQLINPAGAKSGAQRDIFVTTADARCPQVAFDNHLNRYLVVWRNATLDAIQGRVLDSVGANLSTVNNISAVGVGAECPGVAYNPVSQEYLVVWPQGDPTDNIYARRVSPDGVAHPSGSFVISNESEQEQYPRIQADPSDGRYLVVWEKYDNTGDSDIRGRRLLSTGATSGAIFTVVYDTGEENVPDLAFHPTSHQALVLWRADRSPLEDEFYVRMVDADNNKGDIHLVSDQQADAQTAAICYHAQNGVFIVFYLIGFENKLRGRWLSSGGGLLENRFEISVPAMYPSLGCGGALYLAAWQDHRVSNDVNIWAMRGDSRLNLYLPLTLQQQ